MIFIIVLMSFLSIGSVMLAFYYILFEENINISKRICCYTQSYDQIFVSDIQKRSKEKNFREILRVLGKGFEARSYTKWIGSELSKAEIPLKGEEFIVLNLTIAVLSSALAYLCIGWMASIISIAMSMALPFVFIRKKKQKRFERLNQQIGECLTVMANSMRAGYSFQQAIDLVGKETGGPLAQEFRKTMREINFGTTTEEALINLGKRVESDDLGLVITAVLIQRQIGGNLAEILDNISLTIRERIKLKGEIKTLTAQGRISGLIIGLMPPGLLIILMIINPSYISILINNKIGWLILIAGAISEIIGALLIKKVVDIEV